MIEDATIAAIVLAAGFSTRMGQCKATLPWQQGQTLLTYQIAQLLEVGVLPVVVFGSHNAHLRANCPLPCRTVVNPNSSEGKVGSILAGLDALPRSWDAVLVSAVDQPRPAEVYQTLIEAFNQHRGLITLPVRGDRTGHPPLSSRSLLPELRSINDKTQGLRHVVQSHWRATHYVQIHSENIFLDLNIPESYDQALKHHRQKSTTS